MDAAWFLWLGLPLLIMIARVTDVTLGTLRIIFVMRGIKSMAALLGFIEVFIWILVIGRLMSHTTHWLHYAAYAGGFAMGNVIGIKLEERLAFGLQTVRVITMQSVDGLLMALKAHHYGATMIPAFGLRGGRTTILFSTIRRSHVQHVLDLVQEHTPRAFVSIEDVRSAREGIFPMLDENRLRGRLFPSARKGK